MAFTDEQRDALKAKLNFRHVRNRMSDGVMIPYLEGWHVIAEANRIFGHDGWDRVTIEPRCVWRETQRGQTACFYTAKVRVTVTAGGSTIVREGIGTGTGRSAAPEVAHEIALKAAETDATKRALATFGNPFGLALYDKAKSQVTRPRHRAARVPALQAHTGAGTSPSKTDYVLGGVDGRNENLSGPDAYAEATMKLVPTLETLEALYAFWEKNLRCLEMLRNEKSGMAENVIAALKARAREIGRLSVLPSAEKEGALSHPPVLLVPKEKRLRSKAHLAFVAQQPCLVCGRRPAQAHHLRFAQPRAMGLKVSDEFTLPLCSGHHDSIHRTGDERAWWARHGIIEPLKYAERLWTASRLSPDDESILNGGSAADTE